jgi:hypothetical protein
MRNSLSLIVLTLFLVYVSAPPVAFADNSASDLYEACSIERIPFNKRDAEAWREHGWCMNFLQEMSLQIAERVDKKLLNDKKTTSILQELFGYPCLRNICGVSIEQFLNYWDMKPPSLMTALFCDADCAVRKVIDSRELSCDDEDLFNRLVNICDLK